MCLHSLTTRKEYKMEAKYYLNALREYISDRISDIGSNNLWLEDGDGYDFCLNLSHENISDYISFEYDKENNWIRMFIGIISDDNIYKLMDEKIVADLNENDSLKNMITNIYEILKSHDSFRNELSEALEIFG